jgi:type I restriction enzyme R subunit
MQKVLSSRSRMERVVENIVFDFGVKPCLANQRGNAMLVASSIYEATKYFTLFQKTVFKGRCAVITSYNPQSQNVTKEETGANTETEKQFLYNTYTELLKDVEAKPGKSRTESYEDESRRLFISQPANMRLLIVVDKLLTGFDAPSCTYLYIDKSMQDHGLFQAICRTNRLDGEDKPFGYIVDYKDLFQKLVNEKGTGALQVYTSELDHGTDGTSPDVLMQDRLKKGRERLGQAMEQCALLCEPVEPPKGELEHIHYFCGNVVIPDDLKACEPQRFALYKGAASLVRAFANIADDLPRAGYSDGEISQIKADIDRTLKLHETIRKASGETIDLKAYEADMRQLIDTYIEAKEPSTISDFEDMGLLELIVKCGMADAVNSLPNGIKGNQRAVAETIANNVRSKIIKEHLNDPAFYDKMSELLNEILDDLKAKRISYERFLKKIAEQVIAPLQKGVAADTPKELNTPGKRALYSNLQPKVDPCAGVAIQDGDDDPILRLALTIDQKVREVSPADWRGNASRESYIKAALLPLLGFDKTEVERIFLILTAQREY